jgi:hypothetical protein
VPESPARYGATGNAVVIAVVAFMVSRTFHASMVREVVARLEIEALNRDLERRVDAQVAEIVSARASWRPRWPASPPPSSAGRRSSPAR